MATVGFPGSRWTTKNEATETNTMMMRSSTTRLEMYLPTNASPPSSQCPPAADDPKPMSYHAAMGLRVQVQRIRTPLQEAILPFVVARIIVGGVLGLAHFIVDRAHPESAATVARVHQGLLGWDAGWYETIARVGYKPLGQQSLRFFPGVPLLTHALAWLPGVDDGAALVVVANVSALVATALLFALVRRELGDEAVARRAIWMLSLAPAAFVLVMGYAEATLLCLSVGCFLALRPARSVPQVRPQFLLAGLLAFGAALTRPVGVLLALAVVAELVRWWVRIGRRERLAGIAAVA